MGEIDFDTLVPKFDSLLSRGLSNGLGERGGQMCIEAALCEVLGLPHGDDPKCVASDVRSYKIRLNDSNWSSPQARAAGLRDLGIAQLGSNGMEGFSKAMAEKTIRVLIPTLFREVFKNNTACLAAADRCEKEGTLEAVREARAAASAAAAAAASTDAAYADAAAVAYAAYAAAAAAAAASTDAAAAAYAAYAATAAFDAYAATAAAYAAYAAAPRDRYLLLSAKLALEVLMEMKTPGALWLMEHK